MQWIKMLAIEFILNTDNRTQQFPQITPHITQKMRKGKKKGKAHSNKE